MLRQSALRSVPGFLPLRSPSSFPLFSSQARPINCLSLLRVSSSSQRAAASLRNSSSGTTNTMGLKLIPAKNLHVSTPTWWLESRFHFSFAEYYNPQNTEFGVLRVLNDDLVKPRAGFGTHSHRDMEIFTYIIDGKLTHKDRFSSKSIKLPVQLNRPAIVVFALCASKTSDELKASMFVRDSLRLCVTICINFSSFCL
jgi:hypothetical protein